MNLEILHRIFVIIKQFYYLNLLTNFLVKFLKIPDNILKFIIILNK